MKHFQIFEISSLGQQVPEGCNAVVIPLNGQMSGALDWSDVIQAARHYIAEGFDILWDIDFGLFDRLPYPLGSEMQFLSLGLAVDQFIEKVWGAFQDHTVGVALCRCPLDFTKWFPWDEEQQQNLHEWLVEVVCDVNALNRELGTEFSDFKAVTHDRLLTSQKGFKVVKLFCRDVCSEYLSLLRDRFPDEVQVFCLFDADGISDPAEQMQLQNQERYDRIEIVVRGGVLPLQDFIWQKGIFSNKALIKPPLAVCIPEYNQWKPSLFRNLNQILLKLNDERTAYRLIPEERITYEWDGLDQLIVVPELISKGGKRKLLGFCAAGGTVLTVEEPMGLPLEKCISVTQSTR